MPLTVIQAWMGHAHVQTTMIYLHHRPRHDDADLATAAFAPVSPPVSRTSDIAAA